MSGGTARTVVSDEDTRWMRVALSLGERGLGKVWPNPAVGCVIVKDGRAVGRGWTRPTGRPHAETVALQQAGDAARDATAYVSLEPCAHHGKTPPCAGALIKAGVARVVTAMQDPDPRTASAGHAMLRAAGVEVAENVMSDAAREIHAGFTSRVVRARPMLTLKLAMSLDGRIATATGESQWITGPQARRAVHAMRARHDAVLVGAGTARADDPALTVRGMGIAHQPVRVILSRRLDLPRESVLARTAREVPVWLCHGPDAPDALCDDWTNLGARLIEVPSVPGGNLDLAASMSVLAQAGLTRVFCEGGGTLAAGLLAHDLVDELSVFTAGMALGAEGTPGIGAMGIAALAEARRFALRDLSPIGADALARWVRRDEGDTL